MSARTCRCLRTKADYLPARPPGPEAAPAPEADGAAAWWCARTLDCVGPDGGPVSPGECHARRSCHDALPSLGTTIA